MLKKNKITRRQFLKHASIAAFALSLSTGFSTKNTTNSQSTKSYFPSHHRRVKIIFNNFLDNNTLKTNFSTLEYEEYFELVYDTGFENCKLHIA